MSTMIEGVGDEVVWCLIIFGFVLFLLIAWISTGVRPLWNGNSVWLVQMQTWPNRRVLQVTQIDEASASRLEGDANTHTVRLNADQVDPSNDGASGTSLRVDEPVDSLSENSSSDSETVPVETVVNNNSQPSTSESTTNQAVDSDGESTIRLKFLDDTQKQVCAWLTQTVGEFKGLHFNSEVHEGKVIRLIYKGQLLRDDTRSLASYGLHDNCILHCHVSTTPYSQPNNSQPSTANDANAGRIPSPRFQLGSYIYLIFAVKFALLWSVFCVYPQYFDFASMFSLILCTAIYIAFLYCNHRRDRQQQIAANQ